MKILTLYFSRSGHTRRVAGIIQNAVGGDIAPIRTRRSYARSYAAAVIQGGWERLTGDRPALMPLPVRVEEYDLIFIGTPVWWFTLSPAMKTFLAGHRLEGKRVFPFITSGGEPRNAFMDFERLCHGEVGEGFHIYFKGNQMMADRESIRSWAREAVKEGVNE